MRSRALTLMLALTVAGIAAVGVYMYVGQVEQRSTDGLKTVPVLVATRSFPTGTTGNEILEAGALESQSIPQRYALPGAFSRPEDLLGLTLTDNISAGEQITAQRFATAEQNAFLADFPKGMEALAVPLDFVKGVAGHVRPGDRLNAYVTIGRAEGDTAAGATRGFDASILGSGSGVAPVSSRKLFREETETFLLLRNILVQEVQGLSSGAEGDDPTASAANGSSMILAVTDQHAALLIYAQENAKLWYTLVPQVGGGE